MEESFTVPHVALRVARELENPECDLSAVADTLALDPVLALGVLRLASSPLFGGMIADASIHQAVMRLGRERTRDSVLSISILRSTPSTPEPYGGLSFWVLALGTALSAREMAITLHFPKWQLAYTAGLVHGLGEIFLACRHTRRYAQALSFADQHRVTHEVALGREFGASPARLCASLLKRWELPPELVDAVALHPTPGQSPDVGLLPSIVFAADRTCRDLCLGPNDFCFEKESWADALPPEFNAALREAGWANISFYLSDQWGFLNEVQDLARSTYSETPTDADE
jgi:HD-like signal output (HDOD) protein